MNLQPKRFLPTLVRIEAASAAMREVAVSTQRVTVAMTVRPTRTAPIRPAPHFTCNAETLVA